ncbi:MAG: hypothetical protein ACREUK_07710 [Burkholderiales bacterium]
MRAWLFTVMHNDHVKRVSAQRPTDTISDDLPETVQRAAQARACAAWRFSSSCTRGAKASASSTERRAYHRRVAARDARDQL